MNAAKLEIVTAPAEVLSTRCEDCSVPSDDVVQAMLDLMRVSKGAGLAAPQVGIPSRFFVVDKLGLVCNPEIKAVSVEEDLVQEGCLSIPKAQLPVRRPINILVSYFNGTENIETLFSGLEARVVQHEFDHLEGILFVERFAELWKPVPPSKYKILAPLGELQRWYR